jgi:uncharacterized membrane protein YoaK (UPF0700 family)
MADAPMSPRDALVVGALLSFTAGFADASTFVGADGIFCAHVTGNFVVLAADLARHADRAEWLKVATFPVFVVAVLATTWLLKPREAPVDGHAVRGALAVNALLLGAAALGGLAEPGFGAARAIVVVLLVAAMGVQNALHRLRPTLGAMTTVMTGNVTSWLVSSLVPAGPAEAGKRRVLTAVILLFAVGCASGALLVARFGFYALVVPALAAVVARAHVRGVRADAS